MKLRFHLTRTVRLLAVPHAGATVIASAHGAASTSMSSNAPRAGPRAATVTASKMAPAPARQGVEAGRQATASNPHSATREEAGRPAASANRVTGTRAGAGMVVGIDPESGALAMPTRDQMARLAALRSRLGVSTARPSPVHHPDGSVSLDVRSWMRDHAVVRLGADGHPVFGCYDTRDAAIRAAHEAPVPRVAPEER